MASVLPIPQISRSRAEPLLARDLASRGESATIVTVLCDSADKYLSERFWEEA
jgi:cysteine synthase B